MSNIKVAQNDVNQLAQQIETLAREVQTKLSANGDVLVAAQELVRNSTTFVFALGHMYAILEGGKNVNAKVVANPSNTTGSTASSKPHNYHNVRDSKGRFTRV